MSINPKFRKADFSDSDTIWNILKGAIARRKADGSIQWQDGYPNPDVIEKDIQNGAGHVLTLNSEVVGYVALLINDEPEYSRLKGEWLTNGDFVVFHRVAIEENHLGKGLAQQIFHFIEEFAKKNNIKSIKADTNYDNQPMLSIFQKSGYHYCGEVTFRGTPRRAFEKVI
jgi:GNAT superfamily N-acetyltransferase